jgi:hypothetical protein
VMAVIGGWWVNHYGPVADVVFTIVGEEDNDSYEANVTYKKPGFNIPNSIGTVSGSLDIGDTAFRVVSTELEPVDETISHGFNIILNDNQGAEGGNVRLPSTIADSRQMDFPDNTSPAPGLVTPVSPESVIETDVIVSRMPGELPSNSRVDYYPYLLAGTIEWREKDADSNSEGNLIGTGEVEFSPPWGTKDPTSAELELDTSIRATTELEVPDTIGSYQFCVELKDVGYYVPSDSEWHSPINRL